METDVRGHCKISSLCELRRVRRANEVARLAALVRVKERLESTFSIGGILLGMTKRLRDWKDVMHYVKYIIPFFRQ